MKLRNITTEKYILCNACGKPVQNYGLIKLNTVDPSKRYISSGRKMISNFRWELCPKHFKEMLDKIKDTIKKI